MEKSNGLSIFTLFFCKFNSKITHTNPPLASRKFIYIHISMKMYYTALYIRR